MEEFTGPICLLDQFLAHHLVLLCQLKKMVILLLQNRILFGRFLKSDLVPLHDRLLIVHLGQVLLILLVEGSLGELPLPDLIVLGIGCLFS